MRMQLQMMLFLLLASAGYAATNVAPTVQVLSATMRPGTTLLDVTYRITDPDDATVKVRALAFKDGVRSFSNVVRPTTFVEGTATNVGDTITTGVDHTLTWDVRADWSIDLAQVKFEILCQDSRGLLPFDWITIPATTNTTALTISLTLPTDDQILGALLWLYANGDSWLTVDNGNLLGTADSGLFNGEVLTQGATLQPDSPAVFLYKRLNLMRATFGEKDFAIASRTGITNRLPCYAVARVWNEDELGTDISAITSSVINARWVKHFYADGGITLSDRFTGLMWRYNVTASGNLNMSDANSYCADLIYAGYADWFLPSPSRLTTMCPHKGHFSSLSTYPFWWADTSEGGRWRVSVNSCIPYAADFSSGGLAWPVRGGQ
jgi:hypothetical protein